MGSTRPLALDTEHGIGIYSIDFDPTVAGCELGYGSLLLHRSSGAIYKRTGVGSTSWTSLGSGGAGGSTAWADITGKPSTFAPSAHKTSHATGGGDALTPADIGAATAADLAAHLGAVDPHPIYLTTAEANLLYEMIDSMYTKSESDARYAQLAGQLGGTPASPDVRGIRESGGALLTIGAIGDGQMGVRSGTTFVGQAIPSGGGYTPSWVRTGAGVIYGAYGNGNPDRVAWTLDTQGHAGPTATAVGTGVVRLVKFRLPKQLTVTALRAFMLASASTFSFAVYRVSDRARMFSVGLIPGVTNAWLNVAVAGAPVLAADTEYWLAFGTSAVGTTVTWRSLGQPVHANVFGANAAPLSLIPEMPAYAQAAVTIGATPTWPNPLPVPVAAAFVNATTGTIPGVLLEGTAA